MHPHDAMCHQMGVQFLLTEEKGTLCSAGLGAFVDQAASGPRSRYRSSLATSPSAPAFLSSSSRRLAIQQGRCLQPRLDFAPCLPPLRCAARARPPHVRVARISRSVLACARRKQAQHACCSPRTTGFILGSCRCAPPPDPLGWACASRAPLNTACAPQDRSRLPGRQQTIAGSFPTSLS